MSCNRITDIDIVSLSEKDFLSFISKKNQIHEEIKDYVINRFIKKIYEQNKEIQELKRKLEETIKSSLLIIKRNLLKKKYFPVNQIKLSFTKNTYKKSKNFNPILNNLKEFKKQNINQKNNKNNIKSFAYFNKISLKKYLKPHISINNTNSNNSNNNNIKNKLFKYNQSLDASESYRNNSRNALNKDSTFFSEKHFDIFGYENNHKIETINSHSVKRNTNIHSLDKKDEIKKIIFNKNKKNKIYLQNSFNYENTKRVGENKIKILNKNINNKITNKIKSRNFNCLKKLNLSNNIIINNNHNLSNNILDYCITERSIKNRDKIKEIIALKKNIFTCSHNSNNININYVNNINHNSIPIKKKSGKYKLNKVVLKMKEINKNINPLEFQSTTTRLQKIRKKINLNDNNKFNDINYISMTAKISGNKKVNVIKKNQDLNNKENKHENKKKIEFKINEYNNYQSGNSLPTIYNPTFTSFLNRNINEKQY